MMNYGGSEGKGSEADPLNQQKYTKVPAVDLHRCEWHISHYQKVHKQFLKKLN